MPVDANGVLNRRVDELLFAVGRNRDRAIHHAGRFTAIDELRPMVSSTLAPLAQQGIYLISMTTGPDTASVTPRPPPRSSSVSRNEFRVAIIFGRAAAIAAISSHSPMTQ